MIVASVSSNNFLKEKRLIQISGYASTSSSKPLIPTDSLLPATYPGRSEEEFISNRDHFKICKSSCDNDSNCLSFIYNPSSYTCDIFKEVKEIDLEKKLSFEFIVFMFKRLVL